MTGLYKGKTTILRLVFALNVQFQTVVNVIRVNGSVNLANRGFLKDTIKQRANKIPLLKEYYVLQIFNMLQ